MEQLGQLLRFSRLYRLSASHFSPLRESLGVSQGAPPPYTLSWASQLKNKNKGWG